MKNKKILIPMAVTAILSMTLPVFAANITSEGSQDVTVKHTIGVSYTVSIPANFSFEKVDETNYKAEKKVTASDVLIEEGTTLNVKMSSKNYSNEKYTLNDELSGESKIEYTIKNGENAFTNDTNILSVEAGTETAETTLTFETTDEEINKATKSGEHTDTLTFTVSLD